MGLLDWGGVIYQLLVLVNRVLTWAQARGYIKQGWDEAIAQMAREVFRKTEHAKRVMENVDAMSDAEVDAALVGLEPGPVAVQPGGATSGSG